MAEYVEKWGDSIDSAVELALRDLKITRDEAVVTVLEQPSSGFLGLSEESWRKSGLKKRRKRRRRAASVRHR